MTKLIINVSLISRIVSTQHNRVLTKESGVKMTLVDRKRKILEAIINDFISTAHPVGSRTIAKKYDLGVSSATIRNEMADLEELGYLVQPYTSAGRVPSDLAYRLYVDSLMKKKELESAQKALMQKHFKSEFRKIDDVIKYSASILSKITNLTTISMTPKYNYSVVKNVKLIKIDTDKVLLVLVADNDVVKNTVLDLKNISDTMLEEITDMLNHKLRGLKISDINEEVIIGLQKELEMYSSFLDYFEPRIIKSLRKFETSNIYSDGITNIFNLPEYTDIDKAREFISLIEDKEKVSKLLDNNYDKNINVKIGKENEIQEIQQCSIITATYKLNGKTIGTIGVVGPTRIDYQNVIAAMNYLSKLLDSNSEL